MLVALLYQVSWYGRSTNQSTLVRAQLYHGHRLQLMVFMVSRINSNWLCWSPGFSSTAASPWGSYSWIWLKYLGCHRMKCHNSGDLVVFFLPWLLSSDQNYSSSNILVCCQTPVGHGSQFGGSNSKGPFTRSHMLCVIWLFFFFCICTVTLISLSTCLCGLLVKVDYSPTCFQRLEHYLMEWGEHRGSWCRRGREKTTGRNSWSSAGAARGQLCKLAPQSHRTRSSWSRGLHAGLTCWGSGRSNWWWWWPCRDIQNI